MPIFRVISFLILCCFFVQPCVCWASEISNRLALGATVGGWQVHWGLAPKWALEIRGLKGKETSTEGTTEASVYGLRAYRYLRAPSRVRFYAGLEGASTHSTSSLNDYETSGFAAGAFGGSEIYVLKRLTVGVDVGPYFLASNVRRSNTSYNEVYIVINSYMNFYFL